MDRRVGAVKEVRLFKSKEPIPSDAKFIAFEMNKIHGCYFFFYEIPIKKERDTSGWTKAGDQNDTIDTIIMLLNEMTGKKFSLKTKRTRDLIRARINDGHDYNAFHTVIAKKSGEWLTEPKWNQYLRPETLFGTKFESYLNATSEQEMTNQVFGELDNILEGKKDA